MGRHIYRDFDEFADSIRGLAGRFIPTARSAADWWIQAVEVQRIQLQQLQIGGASTFAGDGKSGTVTFGIPMTDPRSIRIDGHGLLDSSFILLKHAQPFTYSGRLVTRWAGVTVPIDYIDAEAELGESILVGASGLEETLAQADGKLLERLRRLIDRICSEDDTVVLVDPVACAAAEEEVLRACVQVLSSGSCSIGRNIGRPQVSRTRVIARCLEFIDANAGQPMLIRDLCKAALVSERTLRNVFQEYFGVGPMRLLKVRQLREIRGALSVADANEQTVAAIATRFGIWDFSLFARNYRALYGESPSTTLRKPPEDSAPEQAMRPTWLRYASLRFVDAAEGSADQ
ncbi:MAG TPA: helix-turn-helix domain-containing protein [Steroidobacteraceae bacterium]